MPVTSYKIGEEVFDIPEKEKDSFERTSAIKDRTIKEIQANLVAMVTSFNRNVGDIFPQDLLEHKDDKYLE